MLYLIQNSQHISTCDGEKKYKWGVMTFFGSAPRSCMCFMLGAVFSSEIVDLALRGHKIDRRVDSHACIVASIKVFHELSFIVFNFKRWLKFKGQGRFHVTVVLPTSRYSCVGPCCEWPLYYWRQRSERNWISHSPVCNVSAEKRIVVSRLHALVLTDHPAPTSAKQSPLFVPVEIRHGLPTQSLSWNLLPQLLAWLVLSCHSGLFRCALSRGLPRGSLDSVQTPRA